MLNLHKMISLVRPKKKVGRGGKLGKTAARGHKGQKARSGGTISPSFEGGQMPLTRRLPKRGFNNTRFQTPVTELSVRSLNAFDNEAEVTKQMLCDAGLLHRPTDSVKILANGTIDKKLVVYIDAISASARKVIEEQGGQVHIIKE